MPCLDAIAAPVYAGRDNVLTLVLYADGVLLADLSGVTRAVVDLDGGTTVIDSDSAPGAIWWTDTANHRGQSVDVLTLQLGNQGIAAGTYSGVEVILYDSTYPNGLQVENPITLTVQ